jgi:hypothetical protein
MYHVEDWQLTLFRDERANKLAKLQIQIQKAQEAADKIHQRY